MLFRSGVGIHDGDWLMMESTTHFNLRDIVLARIDGEDVLKSYMVDEEGRSTDKPEQEFQTEGLEECYLSKTENGWH